MPIISDVEYRGGEGCLLEPVTPFGFYIAPELLGAFEREPSELVLDAELFDKIVDIFGCAAAWELQDKGHHEFR